MIREGLPATDDDGRGYDDSVTICMCTFRRDSAFAALESFSGLTGLDDVQVNILVIDNDETDALRQRFEQWGQHSRFPLRYIHAPARNISIARNAALEQAGTRWIAFIDDDELAQPDWLVELLRGRDGADVVIGCCDAVYGPDLPLWAAACDFHSNRISGNAINAYTSNALIDRAFLNRHAIRFREELGRTGGEDTIFFRQIAEAGGRIVYRPQAVVDEPVPHSRANMRWVRRRMFRAGQTHGLLCREFDRAAYGKLLVTAGAKALLSGSMALLTMPGSTASRRWFARAALHSGAFTYRLRPGLLEEYG